MTISVNITILFSALVRIKCLAIDRDKLENIQEKAKISFILGHITVLILLTVLMIKPQKCVKDYT